MKQLFILLGLMSLVLVGCVGNDEPDPHTYDPRGLVPDECAYLENIDDWQPVWCDEFDVDGLPDPSRWGYDVGGGGWGNNELQFYTNANLNNVFIEDGVLHIQTLREQIGDREYSSARLVTKYRGDWLYGRIQVMARMPSGRGLWPAIWMLPTDWQYGNWPHSGEIDIMEYVGYDPGVVHGTIHTGAYNHMLGTQIGYQRNLPTVEDQFHLYEMIWEPNSIKLYIDGEQFATFGYNPDAPRNFNVSNSDAWPFDQRFHLILNVAVGGDWGGVMGVDNSIFPQAMEIEYVRVYQRDYAGLTEQPPNAPTALTLQRTNHESARIKWTHSVVDVMLSHYNIYVDGELYDKTTLNAINIEGLKPNTTHRIDIEAVDFKDQTSTKASINVTTDAVRSITSRIQAEEYDNALGIRVEETSDTIGSLNVTGIDSGDYLEYILEVEEAGTYRIQYRVASLEGGGQIRLFSRTRFPHATTIVDATGGWQEWQTIASDSFSLSKGVFTFKVEATIGGFNLNYIEFVKVDE